MCCSLDSFAVQISPKVPDTALETQSLEVLTAFQRPPSKAGLPRQTTSVAVGRPSHVLMSLFFLLLFILLCLPSY